MGSEKVLISRREMGMAGQQPQQADTAQVKGKAQCGLPIPPSLAQVMHGQESGADQEGQEQTGAGKFGSPVHEFTLDWLGAAGLIALVAEPVRTKQAHLFMDGDFDAEVFVGSNDWAYVVDPEHPFQLLPNTWACRYGDPEWKFFLDMFCNRMISTGFMRDRFAAYRDELIGNK